MEFVNEIVKRAAPEQGGVISGINPIAFTTTDPIRIWVIQVVIIIGMSQLLALILGRIKQPRVIAEVIGGVILGPTVMGHIPNFTSSVFPAASLPLLSLTATIGLVLFLFLTALEVDVRIVKKNAKNSLLVSIAGILIPFGLGVAIAVPLYHKYVDQSINFGYFLLFVGVAISITAFPVLCRILTETKLLETTVGLVVLSAGVGNDVIGWVLLALTVALVNASGGLVALWILLSSVAWTLFLLFPVKWAYVYLARRTGSIEKGQPTTFMMIITFGIVFISAFMTDILGVHAIFGGFIAGLIIPHEGGFAIGLVERMEDIVTLLLVPIYFALSGLRTNLGLLNTGTIWGYIILLCVTAFFGKFIGCALMARYSRFTWRESSAIGVLMSCKGLVELIVLNIGLQAGILNETLFSAFVVMALVLTFITTPLAELIYPPKYRLSHNEMSKRMNKKKDEEGKAAPAPSHPSQDSDVFKTKFSVVLNKIEHLPAIMTLTQLLRPSYKALISSSQVGATTSADIELDEKLNGEEEVILQRHAKSVSLDALHLIELTERTSAVMQSSEADELIQRDPILAILSTFGTLNSIPVSASLSVVSQESFPQSVAFHARDKGSELIIVPWSVAPRNANTTADDGPSLYNPFEGIFGKSGDREIMSASSVTYSHFIRGLFSTSPADVGLYVDRGLAFSALGGIAQTNGTTRHHHIIIPFCGGPDDRLALSFVVQLCASHTITATVIRVKKTEDDLSPVETTEPQDEKVNPNISVLSNSGFPDTLYAPPNTQTRMESSNADSLLYARLTNPKATGVNEGPFAAIIKAASKRITFEDLVTPAPLRKLIERVGQIQKSVSENKKDSNVSTMIITGRSRRLAAESHHIELRAVIQEYAGRGNAGVGSEISRTVGEVATAFMVSSVQAGLLVMQAALPSERE